MKKLLLILSVAPLLFFSGREQVFICKGGSAYAYHQTRDCRFLQQCTHKIEEVSVNEAKTKYKRKPCKPCYNKKSY